MRQLRLAHFHAGVTRSAANAAAASLRAPFTGRLHGLKHRAPAEESGERRASNAARCIPARTGLLPPPTNEDRCWRATLDVRRYALMLFR